MIDQVLLLNRRQYTKEYSKNKQKKDEEDFRRRTEKEERKRFAYANHNEYVHNAKLVTNEMFMQIISQLIRINF